MKNRPMVKSDSRLYSGELFLQNSSNNLTVELTKPTEVLQMWCCSMKEPLGFEIEALYHQLLLLMRTVFGG